MSSGKGAASPQRFCSRERAPSPANESFAGAVRRILVATIFLGTILLSFFYALVEQLGLLAYVWLGAYALVAIYVAGKLTKGAFRRILLNEVSESYPTLIALLFILVAGGTAGLASQGFWRVLPAVLLGGTVCFFFLLIGFTHTRADEARSLWEKPRITLLLAFPLWHWVREAGKMSVIPWLAIVELVALLGVALTLAAAWFIAEVGVGIIGAAAIRLALVFTRISPSSKSQTTAAALLCTGSAAMLGVALGVLAEMIPA